MCGQVASGQLAYGCERVAVESNLLRVRSRFEGGLWVEEEFHKHRSAIVEWGEISRSQKERNEREIRALSGRD